MGFADPQSVTIAAVPITMPRVSTGVNQGAFKSNDGLVGLSVAHTTGKRTRRTLRLEHSKIAPDPLISSVSIEYSATVYMVVDHPRTGYTVAQLKELVDAFAVYLQASSGAKVTQLLGGEN